MYICSYGNVSYCLHIDVAMPAIFLHQLLFFATIINYIILFGMHIIEKDISLIL